MSSSDWNIAGINNAFPPSISNTAILNSTLSNSLAIGGVFCRNIVTNTSNPNYYTFHTFFLKNTVSSGIFYNVSTSKALRLEGYFRAPSSAPTNAKLGLVAKGASNFSGYFFNISSNSISLNLPTSTSTGGITMPLSQPFTLSASADTWYGLRMDVLPIGSSADVIKCYIETAGGPSPVPTAGGGVWTKYHEQTISSTDTGYVPWLNNRSNGFGHLVYQGTNGFVDLISIKVANAATPIP
jgi:hypothetical protein